MNPDQIRSDLELLSNHETLRNQFKLAWGDKVKATSKGLRASYPIAISEEVPGTRVADITSGLLVTESAHPGIYIIGGDPYKHKSGRLLEVYLADKDVHQRGMASWNAIMLGWVDHDHNGGYTLSTPSTRDAEIVSLVDVFDDTVVYSETHATPDQIVVLQAIDAAHQQLEQTAREQIAAKLL